MPHILIAGAGIGGLTTALALSQLGAEITILERSSELAEAGAGVQLSPNATRILSRLGCLEAVAAHALEPNAIRIRGARHGRTLALLPLAKAAQRWGAPYLVLRRADLQAALYAAVEETPGISLQLGTALAGFGTSSNSVAVTVKQGPMTRTIQGDALIGADGIRSTVRAKLVDGDDPPQEIGRTAWRALVPTDRLPPIYRTNETGLWLGRDAHLVHYRLRDGRLNVVAIIRERASPGVDDLWSAPGDPDILAGHFNGWHRIARDLIAQASSWTTWPLFDRAPLAVWNAGPIALLGDAAHPILPFLAQGAAQAIEDAGALSTAVSATRDLEAAFAAYSATRRARSIRVQETSRQLGRLYHLAGPAAAARDAGMRILGGRRLLARYDWLYQA